MWQGNGQQGSLSIGMVMFYLARSLEHCAGQYGDDTEISNFMAPDLGTWEVQLFLLVFGIDGASLGLRMW